MNAAPTSGRKVTSERSGQWLTAMFRRSAREQVPRHQRDEANHHREGIVVQISGLEAAGLVCEVAGYRGDAVGAEAVDHCAVAGFPQTLAEHESGADEHPVIELIEIPFVQQEQVGGAELGGEANRDARVGNVEEI